MDDKWGYPHLWKHPNDKAWEVRPDAGIQGAEWSCTCEISTSSRIFFTTLSLDETPWLMRPPFPDSHTRTRNPSMGRVWVVTINSMDMHVEMSSSFIRWLEKQL